MIFYCKPAQNDNLKCHCCYGKLNIIISDVTVLLSLRAKNNYMYVYV